MKCSNEMQKSLEDVGKEVKLLNSQISDYQQERDKLEMELNSSVKALEKNNATREELQKSLEISLASLKAKDDEFCSFKLTEGEKIELLSCENIKILQMNDQLQAS